MDFINQISMKVGLTWWDLGLYLGVTETRMQSIRLHNQNKGLNKMAEQMLYFWLKGCETQENKVGWIQVRSSYWIMQYELLKTALKQCGRLDIAERFTKQPDSGLIFGC